MAAQECRPSFLDTAIAQARADVNLHIEPRDLDTLSSLLSSFNRQPSMDLRSHLAVVVDEEDKGLLEVDRRWVAYAAAVSSEKASAVADAWAREMSAQYKDPQLVVTDEMKASVDALIRLCKTAVQQNLPVVHIWMT
jgi:hypothetical protein